jgi:hypothetical protein
MACHHLILNSFKDFLDLIKEREPDFILKTVKCVLNAYKQNKDEIDVFEVDFQDNTDSLTFSLNKDQYMNLLDNCGKDLIKMEEYELCSQIKKIKQKQI